MTRDEFITKIENGSDIMFDVSGKHFTILTWCENGIGIDEQHPNETGMQYFHTAEELLEKFPVDGVPLGALSGKIVITDFS